MKGTTALVSDVKMRRYITDHTDAKNPQTFVANRMTADITKNGRFPHMLAPDAVKKVVKPIQKARKPIIRLDTISILTLYFNATT